MFQRLRELIPLSRNSLVIIGLFVVLAALPLTIFLTQQQQEIRQRAGGGEVTLFSDNFENDFYEGGGCLGGTQKAPNGWTFWDTNDDNCVLEETATTYPNDFNGRSVKLRNGPGNPEGRALSGIFKVLDATPGITYTVTGFSRRFAGESADFVGIRFCDTTTCADPEWFPLYGEHGVGTWNQFGKSKSAPSTFSGFLNMHVFLASGRNQFDSGDQNEVFFDNITITSGGGGATPTPTPVQAASINANPNPVPAGTKNGQTAISWNTGSSNTGQVRVHEPNEPTAQCKPTNKCLFGEAPARNNMWTNATGEETGGGGWIAAGHTYIFDLYDGRCTINDCSDRPLLESVTVTAQGTPAPTVTAPTPTPTSPPGQCTLSATFQTPNRGASCASCIITNRPDLKPFFNTNGHSACTDIQIVNHWCNGGISSQASQECTALVSGTCASQCGSATPTPTLPPGTTALKVWFALQPGGTPRTSTRNIKVEIFNTSSQLVGSARTASANFNATDNTFTANVDLGAGWTTGPYVVKLKLNNTLRKLVENVTNITAGQTNALPRVQLVSGDINDDNKLDATDYANVVGCLDIKRGTPQYVCPGQNPTLTDLNDNGIVDTQDLAILIVNFSNRTGD